MAIRGPGASQSVTTPTGTHIAVFYMKVTVARWFANVNEVRLLLGPGVSSSTVLKESFILTGTEEHGLQFTNIVANSDVLFVISTTLAPDVFTISSYAAVSLTNAPVVQGTLKAYNDGDEDAVLAEGSDFTVNYEKGTLKLVDPSASSGQASSTAVTGSTAVAVFYMKVTVTVVIAVHYDFYNQMTRDSDFSINYVTGRVARITGGSITSGVKVYVDYKTGETVENLMIEFAIGCEHALLIIRIGSSYEGSTDVKLKFAETYLAAANVASMVMSKVINQGLTGAPNVHTITRNLKRIEESHRIIGERFMGEFVSFGLSSAGDVKQNVSFESAGVLR